MQDAAPSIIPLETSSTSIYVPMPTSRYNLKSAEGAARVSSWGGANPTLGNFLRGRGSNFFRQKGG